MAGLEFEPDQYLIIEKTKPETACEQRRNNQSTKDTLK